MFFASEERKHVLGFSVISDYDAEFNPVTKCTQKSNMYQGRFVLKTKKHENTR